MLLIFFLINQLSDQIRSVAQSCPTLCNPMNHSTPGIPVHHQLLEFTETHFHLVSDTIQPSHSQSPLLRLPSIPPSIRVFSNESTLRMRWSKYWRVLKSPTVIVLLLISPFILLSISLTYYCAPMLGAYMFITVISSWIDPLIIM